MRRLSNLLFLPTHSFSSSPIWGPSYSLRYNLALKGNSGIQGVWQKHVSSPICSFASLQLLKLPLPSLFLITFSLIIVLPFTFQGGFNNLWLCTVPLLHSSIFFHATNRLGVTSFFPQPGQYMFNKELTIRKVWAYGISLHKETPLLPKIRYLSEMKWIRI